LNIDPDEVARKVSPQTACVLPVDIAGCLADYRSLRNICKHHDLPLIADASHSLGATCRKRTVAQLADAAIHSLQATKNLTAAEGGLVVSRHKILVDQVRLLSTHAMTATAHKRRKTGSWTYDVVDLGLKANLSDVHAAIGLGQLSVFEKNQAKRARLAQRYCKRLESLAEHFELPPVGDHCQHAWHLFIIRLHLSRLRIKRDRFIRLMADSGIECGVHYRPIFELSYYRRLGFTAQYFPNAAYAGRRVVSLPMHPELTMADIDFVCDNIERILRKHAR